MAIKIRDGVVRVERANGHGYKDSVPNERVGDYLRRLERIKGTRDDETMCELLKELVCTCGGDIPCRKGVPAVDLPNGPSVFTRVWLDPKDENLKADYHSDWDGDGRIRTFDLDDCNWIVGYVVPFIEDASFLNGKSSDIDKEFPLRYVRLDQDDFYNHEFKEEPFAKVHNKLISVCAADGFRYGWTVGPHGEQIPYVSFGSGSDLQVRGVGREGVYVVSDRAGKVGLHDAVTFSVMFEKGLARTCRPGSLLIGEYNTSVVKRSSLKL